MKYYTLKAKLLKMTKRNLSFYGNPAWTLLLDYEGEIIQAKTASNAGCSYGMTNHKIGDFLTIKGHYTQKGNFIVDYIKD